MVVLLVVVVIVDVVLMSSDIVVVVDLLVYIVLLVVCSSMEVGLVDVFLKWGVDTILVVQLCALRLVSKETMVWSQVGVVATECFAEVVSCELFSTWIPGQCLGLAADVGNVLALWALKVVVVVA